MTTSVSLALPVRLQSSRLPGKALESIGNQPLLWHVWTRAHKAAVGPVRVLTDSPEVYALVESWGGEAIMTPETCTCGTERIAAVVSSLPEELIVNVQVDQALLDPDLVRDLVMTWQRYGYELLTAAYPIRDFSGLFDPNTVKVIRIANGDAIYFSRSPIPFARDVPREQWHERHEYWGHVGIYGYSRRMLENYHAMPRNNLEDIESLEQLRFIAQGHRFHVIETTSPGISVDTPDDLARVRDLTASSALP